MGKFLFLFALSLAVANAAEKGIHFNRTVSSGSGTTGSLSVTPASDCAGKDEWGVNNCNIPWKQTISLDLKANFKKQVTKGKIDVDLKVKGIPLKFECPICGANCTFDVPIIKIPVTITLPDCPLDNPLDIPLDDIELPDKSPLGPIKVPIKGTVATYDQDGNSLVKISIDALLDYP